MNSITKNALTFVAGYCDTTTFIGMGGVFSAHVTGNFILFAASLAKGFEPHDYIKILTFPVFVIAVMVGTLIHHHVNLKEGKGSYKTLLLLVTCILFAASVLSFVRDPQLDILVTMMVVASLAMQSTIHRFLPGPMTTVMTGLVMNTTAIVTEKLFLKTVPQQEGIDVKSATASVWLIASFLIGAVLAALLTISFGLIALILPAFVMLVVITLEWERDK